MDDGNQHSDLRCEVQLQYPGGNSQLTMWKERSELSRTLGAEDS